jgi:hypothetical protein
VVPTLRERATVLLNTYVAYLVFQNRHFIVITAKKIKGFIINFYISLISF